MKVAQTNIPFAYRAWDAVQTTTAFLNRHEDFINKQTALLCLAFGIQAVVPALNSRLITAAAATGFTVLACQKTGKIFQEAIHKRTTEYQNDLTWERFFPPTDFRLTLQKTEFIKDWGNFIQKRDSLSMDDLNLWCNRLFQTAEEYAEAIASDVKDLSYKGSFVFEGATYSLAPAKLMTLNGWQGYPAFYFFSAYFWLPQIYRTLYHTTPSFETKERWQERFFEKDELQNGWRLKHNELMAKIIEAGGGKDAFSKIPGGERWVNWGELHSDPKQKFLESPDCLPN